MMLRHAMCKRQITSFYCLRLCVKKNVPKLTFFYKYSNGFNLRDWDRVKYDDYVVRSVQNASKNPRISLPAYNSRFRAAVHALRRALPCWFIIRWKFIIHGQAREPRTSVCARCTGARAITIYRRSFLFGRPCTRGQRENLPRDKFRKSIRFAKHSTTVVAMLWNTPTDVERRELI